MCKHEQNDLEHLLLWHHRGGWKLAGDGEVREEETHETHFFRAADLRSRENFRAEQVLGGTRKGETGLQPPDDWITSQGDLNLILNIIDNNWNIIGIKI